MSAPTFPQVSMLENCKMNFSNPCDHGFGHGCPQAVLFQAENDSGEDSEVDNWLEKIHFGAVVKLQVFLLLSWTE